MGLLPRVCGVAGPVAFVGAWVAGGLHSPGYDPVRETISHLAERGAPTAALMTGGFVAFGVLLPVYARTLPTKGARLAATVSGLATLAVAGLPLSAVGGQPVDSWHAVAAGTGYAGQALAPLLAARAVPRRRLSYGVSGVAAGCLVGSALVPSLAGLLQRTGLTVVDAWFVVGALQRRP